MELDRAVGVLLGAAAGDALGVPPATARSCAPGPSRRRTSATRPRSSDAARAVSALTHHDPQAADACVLWCLAIDHAVRTGELDVRVGLAHVGAEWARLLDDAERSTPARFGSANGWVVAALQATWSAAVHADGLVDGIEAAVRGGGGHGYRRRDRRCAARGALSAAARCP